MKSWRRTFKPDEEVDDEGPSEPDEESNEESDGPSFGSLFDSLSGSDGPIDQFVLFLSQLTIRWRFWFINYFGSQIYKDELLFLELIYMKMSGPI